ncbi:ABC transporter [Micromonospora rosaria]|uniref:ABC transporter n=1 Tax=Micromonospora rosaria TaxID=47874 RepID=A0A136PPJ0_9ACTN|nr:ABC transporter ATP-binding protein [Micromonospora rosaria]KXK60274.1 ABC transporter [Micromonospora rosaria]
MTAAGPAHEPLLRVDGLRKVYPSAQRPVVAIDGLSFDVAAGEFVCVVGPSGGGKSTLLKVVSGLLPPTDGRVLLDGASVTGPVPGLAVVFQEYGRSLYAWKTVRDNVALPLLARRVPRAERHRRAQEALAAVGLADAGRAYPWQLSGGMQQRVAIARAIVGEPRVLLMDEPFAAVDAQTRADLEDLVRAIWRRLGITVLFITHDIDESVYLGGRVLVLSRAPATIRADLTVDLPAERDQLGTRADARFAALRAEVFRLIAAEGTVRT